LGAFMLSRGPQRSLNPLRVSPAAQDSRTGLLRRQ
jgi:hypothetical protein